MTKFKIGDVVRRINSDILVGRHTFLVGQTAKITDIRPISSHGRNYLITKLPNGTEVSNDEINCELVNQNPKLKSLRKELILKWKENSK